MLRLILSCSATLVAITASCSSGTVSAPSGPAPLSRDEAIYFAYTPIEGMSAVPPDMSARIMHDSATLNYYARLLEGRANWPPGSDTGAVLYWLAKSGQRRFLPIFLSYAQVDPIAIRRGVFDLAVWGLVQQDTVAAARERLLELGKPTVGRAYRESLARILAANNRAVSRDILREVTTSDLHPVIQERVKKALSLSSDP